MKRLVLLSMVSIIISACSAAAAPTATALPIPTDMPTLVPSDAPTRIAPPSATFTATSNIPTDIPPPTPILVDPLLNVPVPPPIDIQLPEDWQFGFDTLLFQDIDGSTETVPFALYTGPVTDGTGTIVLVWGFDSVTTGISIAPEFGRRDIWIDTLRILRTVILDARCVIGTAPQRDYTIGERAATGSTFSAIDCPEGQPDTRGWYAGVVEEDLNFGFFSYIDPLPPAGSAAEFELQAILDTVVFRVDEFMLTQEDFEATQQALALTITPGG